MSYIEKSVGAQAQYAGVARCSRCGAELPPTAKHASPAQCIETLRARVAALQAEVDACGDIIGQPHGATHGHAEIIEETIKEHQASNVRLAARVAELELENSRLRTPLRPIVDRIHKALGCAEQSDDESLPEMVETLVREHREKIAELEREVERAQAVSDSMASKIREAAEVIHAHETESRELQAEVERVREERGIAIGMLSGWCIAVDQNGTGWDDWDEWYKDAAYRPGPLRALLDAEIARLKAEYGYEDADRPSALAPRAEVKP